MPMKPVTQIQINTVVRPPAVEGIMPCSFEQMQRIAACLGPEAEVVVPKHPEQTGGAESRSLRKRLLELLKRRPCTLEDIIQSVGTNRLELIKVLDELVQSDLLQVRSHEDHIYYKARSSK